MSGEIRNPEEEKQFITTTYIDLTRHGSRFGGPMTIKMPDGSERKFDDGTDITPEGTIRSAQFGERSFPQDVSLVHPRGGDEPRHGQTGESILEASGKIGSREFPSPVRDQKGRVKGSRRGKGVDYASAGMNPALKAYKDLINDELNRTFAGLSQEEQERFLQNPEVRAKYREQAQGAGLREGMKNEKLAKLAAENEAYELMHVVELSRRGVKGGETKAVPVVGSGMFAESLFKYTLVVEDEKTGERKIGFRDIDEIGGFTKQATSFRIKLSRDTRMGDARNINDFENDTQSEFEFTDSERAELFKGKKVSLDWDRVRKLAKSAEERFDAQS